MINEYLKTCIATIRTFKAVKATGIGGPSVKPENFV